MSVEEELSPGDQRGAPPGDASATTRVIIMGEDISGGTGAPGDQDAWGGPLGVTKGLRPEFGPERVLDTHLAEISFVGAAAGAAATGFGRSSS